MLSEVISLRDRLPTYGMTKALALRVSIDRVRQGYLPTSTFLATLSSSNVFDTVCESWV